MFRTSFYILFLSIALAGCAVQSEDSLLSGPKSETSRQFVETVLLGSEYGDSGAVTRFARSPRLSVFGADNNKRFLVQSAISQINGAIAASGIQIQVASENDRNADILVYYAPMSQFAQIARDNGFEYHSGNSGFFWMFWNGNHEITKSIVMIATDVLNSTQLASVTLEEITQSLGPVNDQRIIQDSIFFESSFDSGYATKLGGLDKSLLKFLYGTLRPGDAVDRVDYYFNRYWTE